MFSAHQSISLFRRVMKWSWSFFIPQQKVKSVQHGLSPFNLHRNTLYKHYLQSWEHCARGCRAQLKVDYLQFCSLCKKHTKESQKPQTRTSKSNDILESHSPRGPRWIYERRSSVWTVAKWLSGCLFICSIPCHHGNHGICSKTTNLPKYMVTTFVL